jgi:hypothetical protein
VPQRPPPTGSPAVTAAPAAAPSAEKALPTPALPPAALAAAPAPAPSPAAAPASAARVSMGLQGDLDELQEDLLSLPGPALPDDTTGYIPRASDKDAAISRLSAQPWLERHRRPLLGLLALCPLAIVAIAISWVGMTSIPAIPNPDNPDNPNAGGGGKHYPGAPVPRALTIHDGHFHTNPRAVGGGGGGSAGSSGVVLLVGTNVVMKGAPWLPDANGTTSCADKPPHCDDMQGCNITCTSFNAADAANLKRQGYNLVRLGVVWAGAQPAGPGTALDKEWLRRLHAILEVCHAAGIYVILGTQHSTATQR